MGGCSAVSKYASALLKATRACPWSQLLLLTDICDVTPGSDAFKPFQLSNRHPHMKPTQIALIESQDIYGSPTPAGLIAGGSGRLETQAACPFMGFAVYRLGLPKPADARDLLDAHERGTLLHWVLEKVYSLAPNSTEPSPWLKTPWNRSARRR